jgi:hypothetical protein
LHLLHQETNCTGVAVDLQPRKKWERAMRDACVLGVRRCSLSITHIFGGAAASGQRPLTSQPWAQ